MQTTPLSFSDLSDRDLLATVKHVAERERQVTVQLIALLVELDTRRLHLSEGCSSLFVYCTRVLCLSEHAAYGRIEAARAARRFPVILELLADGAINLTTVTLLAPHLTSGNVASVLNAAKHKSKRDIERQVASLSPRRDAPSCVRRQPSPQPSLTTTAPRVPNELSCVPAAPAPADHPSSRSATIHESCADSDPRVAEPLLEKSIPPAKLRRPVVEPLPPERYKVQVTVGAETIEKLRRVQDLMRHTLPDGDPAAIFDRALTLLLEHLERTKLGTTPRPRASRPSRTRSRHIPAAVRRAVWVRDQGQCAFVGREGRCAERGFLEFHHKEPYALGGEATVSAVALRCRAHNMYEAEQEFDLRPGAMSRSRSCSTAPVPSKPAPEQRDGSAQAAAIMTRTH